MCLSNILYIIYIPDIYIYIYVFAAMYYAVNCIERTVMRCYDVSLEAA